MDTITRRALTFSAFSVVHFYTIPTRNAVCFRMILFCCSWSFSPCFCYSARFKRFLHRLALASHWLEDLKIVSQPRGKSTVTNSRYCRFLKHQQQANISPFFIGEFYSTFEQLCWLKNQTLFYCLKTTSQLFFAFTEKMKFYFSTTTKRSITQRLCHLMLHH
jgi:hypothetical protein